MRATAQLIAIFILYTRLKLSFPQFRVYKSIPGIQEYTPLVYNCTPFWYTKVYPIYIYFTIYIYLLYFIIPSS